MAEPAYRVNAADARKPCRPGWIGQSCGAASSLDRGDDYGMSHEQPPDRERLEGGEPAPPPDEAEPTGSRRQKVSRTRVSGTWVALIVGLLVLIFLLIFIVQNLATATVYFLGATGTLPLAVAMLLAAVAGGLVVALVGGARIYQLRREARRSARGK